MEPITPHFSNECLEILNVKNQKWPEFDETKFKEDKISIVIQINGKKRGLINTKIDIIEKELLEVVFQDEKIKKYLENNEIKRKIYIKNKLLNIIV